MQLTPLKNQTMRNLVLNAKHWHLFVLSFGIPFLMQIIMFARMMTKVFTNKDLLPTSMFSDSMVLLIITAIFYAILPLWIWIVATGLQDKVPENVKLKVNRFRIFFIIPVVYFILYMILFFPSLIKFQVEPTMFLIIMPLHFFAMFCMIYCIYFTAKTLKTVELQRLVHSSDYIGEFFLIWLFPIGVWFIQPRINKIVQQ
jgi:hypothetical protein